MEVPEVLVVLVEEARAQVQEGIPCNPAGRTTDIR